MKAFYTLMLLLLLVSSSQSYASDFLNHCKDNLKILLSTTDAAEAGIRLKRTKELNEALNKGEIEVVLDIMKESHDNTSKTLRMGQLLKGRSLKKDKKLTKMREKTGSIYVPAYHQNNKGDTEIFSTVFQISDGKHLISDEEALAIKDVNTWIKEYEAYWDRMRDAVREASEAGFLAQHIKSKYFGKNPIIKESDFPQPIPLPFLDQKGAVYWDNIDFTSLTRLEAYMKDKQRLKDNTFATGMLDNILRKSELYDIMYQQGMNYRKLELVYIRLSEIGRKKLDDDQIKLLDDIIDVIENKPNLRPRSDVVEILFTKEYKAERSAKWRFWRSKRVKTKYAIPDSLLNKVEGVSPQGMMTKYLGLSALITAGGAVVAGIALPMEELPAYQYFLATVENYKNDFLLNVTGTNAALVACGKEADRGFSFKNGASKAFLEAHLSRHRIRTRFDEDYDHNTDDEVQKTEQELRIKCIKTRHNYRQAEAHATNVAELELSYRMAVDSLFIDLIEEQHPKGEELAPILDKLFGNHLGENDLLIHQNLSGEISDIDEDLSLLLPDYFKNAKKGAEALEQIGSMPKYRNMNEFVDSLTKRYLPPKKQL